MKKLLQKKYSKIVVNIVSVIILFILAYTFLGTTLLDETGSIVSVTTSACISIIMVVSLNISAGSMGEVILGHAGFMAIGAYAGCIFAKVANLNSTVELLLSLLIGGLLSAIFGFLVGLPVLRLRGDYLAIVTLGFGEIVRACITNFDEVVKSDVIKTNGGQGLTSIPLNTTPLLAMLVCFISVAVIVLFIVSRHGRAILSIREDEIAAEASGVNVTKYKVLAFTISAFFAGVAGALQGQYIGVLMPSDFGINASVDYLVMVVFGGMGSYTGSVISAFFLTFIKFFMIDLSQYRMILYGVLLIIIMIFRPGGLMGIKEFSMTKFLIWMCDIKTHAKNGYAKALNFFKNFPSLFKNFVKKIPSAIKGFLLRRKKDLQMLLCAIKDFFVSIYLFFKRIWVKLFEKGRDA